MTFPIDLHLGVVTIPSHLITDILAFYLGYKYYAYLRNKKGDHVSDSKRFTVIIGAALGALIGSRLLGSAEHLQMFLHPDSLLYYYANKTIIGGLIGGTLGVEIAKKWIGQKTPTGDLFTFPIILGIIIGRIGCFLTGVSDETVGAASSLPWAFDQGDGIARHPTSLYEILFLGLLFYVLKRIPQGPGFKQGTIFRLFMVFYLLFRFCIDFIKPVEQVLWGLSVIQVVCLLFAAYYLYTLIFVFKYRPFGKHGI